MPTFLRVLILISSGWLALVILVRGRRARGDRLGRAPIAGPAFLLAKLGVTVSVVLLTLKAAAAPQQLRSLPALACVSLLMAGTSIFTLGMLEIGGSLRVGLPREQTTLITSGIYGFSRNPIYVGIYLIMAASLVYAFSWLNVGASLIGIILHHRIILSEERFLAGQFDGYEAYCSRVRRYF